MTGPRLRSLDNYRDSLQALLEALEALEDARRCHQHNLGVLTADVALEAGLVEGERITVDGVPGFVASWSMGHDDDEATPYLVIQWVRRVAATGGPGRRRQPDAGPGSWYLGWDGAEAVASAAGRPQ